MSFFLKRALFVGVLAMSVMHCTTLIGEFKDCNTNVDCWNTYERNDLVCRSDQCVIHEQHENCNIIVGDTDETKHDGEMITFGAIMAMTDAETGESNPRGSYRSKAMALAYDYFNERGGVDGKNFRLRICDHQKDATRVEALARYLVEDRGLPLVVTGGSSDTINASVVAIPTESLTMSISATALDISDLDDDDLVWRVVPSDKQIGKAVAESIEVADGPASGGSEAAELDGGVAEAGDAGVASSSGGSGAPKVGVIYVNDPFGQGLQAAFEERYRSLHQNAEIVAGPFNEQDEASVLTVLDSLNAANPDKLFIIAFATEATLIANKIAGSDYPNLPRGCDVIFADAMKDQAFLDGLNSTAPSVLEGASIPSWGASGPVYDTFSGAFETTYDLDPSAQGYLAHAYDLAFVSALAAIHSNENQGAVTGLGLVDGMKNLSDGEAFEMKAPNITAMTNALKSSGKINVFGATGDIDFDSASGEPLSGQITISYISGGAFVGSNSTICSSDNDG
ncbi:MAG: hypothetical protein CMH56_01035 [Myxococcales bacterium]|nr:hypothetical protein [Myxococcales bacterium]|tara:strand:+ start:123 stop:1652 length:1530 start_codon:yes stop_codon:yes gene_type:complete